MRSRPASSRAAGAGAPSRNGTADGATVCHAPSASGRPPSHGRCEEALRPACASWMPKRVPGGGHPARGCENARQRRLVGIRVEAQAAVRDAADALHGGRLDDDEAGAGDGELHQVLQVPVGGAAVLGGILAHGGDGDAIGAA